MSPKTYNTGIDINSAMIISNKRWKYFTARVEAYVPVLANINHINIDVQIYLNVYQLPDNMNGHTKARIPHQTHSKIKNAVFRITKIALYLANPLLRPITKVIKSNIKTLIQENLLNEINKKTRNPIIKPTI